MPSSGVPGGSRAAARMGKVTSNRVAKYAMAHPMKAGVMGIGGLAAAKFVTSGRRGRGVSKSSGRATGMYKY